jgi:hypothetical protein
MTMPRGEDLLVGLIALALVPIILWRIRRGLRDGRLPVYRTYLERDADPTRFRVLLVLHCLSVVVVAAIAAHFLLGLHLRSFL